MVPILVIITFVTIATIYALVQKSKHKTLMTSLGLTAPAFPDYQFTPGHLWLDQLAPGRYRLGPDELILRFVGDPDKIHLMEDGRQVKAGEPLAILSRRGKEVYLRAPADARIIRSNRYLASQPRAINLDPYRRGWLYLVELVEPGKKLDALRTGDLAKAWIIKELARLKEFAVQSQPIPALTGATLLDGGELVDHVIDLLDQKTVSDFEKQFLMTGLPEWEGMKK